MKRNEFDFQGVQFATFTPDTGIAEPSFQARHGELFEVRDWSGVTNCPLIYRMLEPPNWASRTMSIYLWLCRNLKDKQKRIRKEFDEQVCTRHSSTHTRATPYVTRLISWKKIHQGETSKEGVRCSRFLKLQLRPVVYSSVESRNHTDAFESRSRREFTSGWVNRNEMTVSRHSLVWQ